MALQALGMIETRGLVALIEAADAMCKAADVELVGYDKAGIPMLPVVVPAHAWTLAILVHSVALAAVSLVPLWFGEGLLYGLGAGIGGGYFVWKSVKLYRVPSKENAMANFFASLVQLALLIAGAVLASTVRHWL
jgi:heme o synthase